MLKNFAVSIIAGIFGLAAVFYYGGADAALIAVMLTIMEISLSFDNAIINAAVLKDMDPKWQQRFLTWGILIAVFGMRLVFPIVLVAFVTHLNSWQVFQLALNSPEQYSQHLMDSHGTISAFGGMFLLMVFLNFILDHKRDIHWLGVLEQKIAQIGNLQSMEVVFALLILVALQAMVPEQIRSTLMLAGICGIVTYVIIHSLAKFMNNYYGQLLASGVRRGGFMSFVYLEVLDASFSFDGVIGAFAITKDIVIIMTGLGIGAFFVRSLTILLVHRKTLQRFIYLEHGAHYALGALALMMLYSIQHHLSEILIGGVGVVLIILSYISSIRRLPK